MKRTENKPIFIAGLQRSGTSLMRGIIGSHPTVAIFQWDLPLWTSFYDRYKYKNLDDVTIWCQLIQEILSHTKVQEASIILDRNAIFKAVDGESHVACGVIFEHILRQYATQVGRPRWGLKTPNNEFYAEAIFKAYPNAKMIHMIRDPRDVAVSIKSTGWGWNITEHIQLWKRSTRLA